MDRFILAYLGYNGKMYTISKGVTHKDCIEKLGIIEDMIESGEISQKIADKIEQRLKLRDIKSTID